MQKSTSPQATHADKSGMHGLITTRHLVTNAPTIIHEFGIVTYLRCLSAAMLTRRRVTFLECVLRLK